MKNFELILVLNGAITYQTHCNFLQSKLQRAHRDSRTVILLQLNATHVVNIEALPIGQMRKQTALVVKRFPVFNLNGTSL